MFRVVFLVFDSFVCFMHRWLAMPVARRALRPEVEPTRKYIAVMFLASTSRFLWRRTAVQVMPWKNVRMAHGLSPVQNALTQLKDIAVTPEEPQLYKEAVKIYNPLFSYENPAFVAFPRNVEEVKRCLRTANDTGTPVAIKSGGHCFAGYSTTDSNGFVISLKNMNSVTLNKDAVTAQAGSTWGDVYSLLDSSDYVAVGGCVPCVGIGGYILGGGYSMLSRAYGGLACDKAVSFTLVTADGEETVVASEDENKDLFWALKGGGGGNFGVLTDVTLKVCARPRQFIWYRFTYDDADSTEKGLNAIGAQLKVLPRELNLDLAIHGYFGKKVLTVDAVYSDHHEAKVETAFKSLHPTTTSSPQVYTSYLKFVTEYSKRHGFVHYEIQPIYVKGAMIQALPPDLAKYFANLDIPPECLLEFVHMGGDIQSFSPTATAFPYRSAQYSFYTYGRFASHDVAHKKEVFEFATSTYNAVKESKSALGSYVNYMDRHLKDWGHEFYGVNYGRLCEVKEKWNPLGKGSLHFDQEIGSTWEPPSQ